MLNLYHRVADFHRFIPTHYTIAPSELIAARMSSALNVPLPQVLPCGNPRTDAVAYGHELPSEAELPALLAQFKDGSPVVLYCPTFRDGRLGCIKQLQAFDLALGQVSLEKQPTVILRRHPWDQQANASIWEELGSRFLNGERIQDVYQLLAHVDLVVTDYSSIFVDALFLRKPVAFFRPDHQTYLAYCRGLYHDRSESLVPTAHDAQALTDLLQETAYCRFNESMQQLRDYYWAHNRDSVAYLGHLFQAGEVPE